MPRPTIVVDLLNACADPAIARVALASLREETAERVAHCAASRGVAPAAYVAARVRRFAAMADDAAIARLADRMKGVDQPLLAGMEAIVSPCEPRPN